MTRFFQTQTVFLFSIFVFSVNAQITCPFTVPIPPKETDVRSTWETAPLLLVNIGSESDHQDPVAQSNRHFLKFIYANFRYPKIDPHAVWGDMIVVTFVIDAEGKVDPGQVRCVRTPHNGLGQEAERVIRLMADLDMRWQPATIGGEAVPVRFNVPIRLRLE